MNYGTELLTYVRFSGETSPSIFHVEEVSVNLVSDCVSLPRSGTV